MSSASQAEIARLSATQMRRRIGSKELSPVELLAACLAQIDAHNGTINAVVTISETALDEAVQAEAAVVAGDELGPLHGVPVGIKDVTEVAGLRTTYGSPFYADHVSQQDALVVERLRAAGAIILGKTNTPEFATGGNTFNDVFGATRNPWNTDLSAGGSTGGGAAGLASGMIALAEGTDLGGSLRIPASFCGVVGLRGSPGLVPSWPSAFRYDLLEVTGFMARTAQDLGLTLDAVAGASSRAAVGVATRGRDFAGAAVRGLPEGARVAYCSDIAGIGVDSAIDSVCREAAFSLEQAGAEVEEIALDLSFARDAFGPLRGLWMVVTHRERMDVLAKLGDNVRGNIERGLAVTAADLAAAEGLRARLWDTLAEHFSRFDYLLTPCVAVPPFPVEQNYPETIGGQPMATYIDWVAPTFVLSMTSLPVGSVPAGLDPDGLPVGLQVVGPPRGEEAVLGLAAQMQALRPIGLPP